MTAVLELPTQSVPAQIAINGYPKPYRMTVEKYHQLIEVGVFTEHDKVQLIEGRLVEMSPKGVLHAMAVSRINRQFSRRFDDLAVIRIQDPIQLNNKSEPEPDLVLARLPVCAICFITQSQKIFTLSWKRRTARWRMTAMN
jgi:Uma2 family endonuclease